MGRDPGPLDGATGFKPKRCGGPISRSGASRSPEHLGAATFQTLMATSAGRDAVQEAQTPRVAPQERPEQQCSAHDRSDRFQATQALPSSPAFADQPD